MAEIKTDESIYTSKTATARRDKLVADFIQVADQALAAGFFDNGSPTLEAIERNIPANSATFDATFISLVSRANDAVKADDKDAARALWLEAGNKCSLADTHAIRDFLTWSMADDEKKNKVSKQALDHFFDALNQIDRFHLPNLQEQKE
jgi:hypothetical protein